MYLFTFLIVSVLLLIGIVYVYIGDITAIKGSYALLGVILASLLYWIGCGSNINSCESERISFGESNRINRYATKLVLILVVSAYIFTYVTGERTGATIVALLFGYTLVGIQLIWTELDKAVVSQIVVLFTVNPVTKYISTGFYYGETDLFGHVRAIELFTQTGQIEKIGEAYTTYGDFPALHIVSASISSFTGLPASDSLLSLGILTYCATVLAVYYICQSILSSSHSVAITFIFASLSTIYYHTSYFFPQAFATAIFILFLYIIIRRERSVQSFQPFLSITSALIVVTLAFAHHVTQIVLIIFLVGMYIPSIFGNTKFGQRLLINKSTPRITPMLFALTAGTTHLVLSSDSTISYFLRFVTDKAGDPFVSDSGGQRVVFGMGKDIPYHTPREALESLVYIDGIYYIGLLSLFVIGVVVILIQYRCFTSVSGFLLLGVVGSLAVLRTPLINTISRLTLPFGFFFAIVTGIGLWAVLSNNNISDNNSKSAQIKIKNITILMLIISIGVTGPLVASDDLYDLHAGPNLWETYSTPEQQVEFSDQELVEFESLNEHMNKRSSDVSMLWVSREAVTRFGEQHYHRPISVSKEGIRTESLFVYRTKWTEHQVGYSTDRAGTLAIADWWLYREVDATNKVYTTGMTGTIWEDDNIELSNNRTAG